MRFCRTVHGRAPIPDRARDTGRPGTRAIPSTRFSIRPQIHLRARGSRRQFAEVDGHDLMPVGQVGDDEAATPQVSRFRKGHRQGERRGHRGVDSISPAHQDVPPRFRRIPFLGHDHMLGKRLRISPSRAAGDLQYDRGHQDHPSRRHFLARHRYSPGKFKMVRHTRSPNRVFRNGNLGNHTVSVRSLPRYSIEIDRFPPKT